MAILDRIKTILKPAQFDDFNYFHEDEFLDGAFSRDEALMGPRRLAYAQHQAKPGSAILRSLTAQAAHGGRIPFFDMLRTSSLKIDWEPGWNGRGAPVMAPIGVLNHWTAAKPSTKRPHPSLIICRDGRPAAPGMPAVPGPLVQILIGLDGRIHILASGRANHAGKGHVALLDEIRANKLPGATAAQRKLSDTGGSGGSLIGIELEHSGAPGAVMPKVQADAWIGILAAIATFYGWNPTRVCWHHALWTRRKIDFTAGRMAPWTGNAWLLNQVTQAMRLS
jgi:N-acetylmuramoyl-L-alanine amidase